MLSFQQILHYLYVLFFKEQAFLVSNDRDVVSYILNASQGESKHHITKCKTNLSKCRRLNLALEPCRTVQMIRVGCKQICHTRPSFSSTGWPNHVILIIRKKDCRSVQCVTLCTVRCPCIQNAPGYYMYICVYDTGAY